MTMLNREHCLSSSTDLFAEECDNLKEIFLKLKYRANLINSTITRFIELWNQPQVGDVQASVPVRIFLPFKDKKSANVVQRQLSDLGKKINRDLHPGQKHSATGKCLRDTHNQENKDLREQFTILKKMSQEIWMSNLWNALYLTKETWAEHSIWLFIT